MKIELDITIKDTPGTVIYAEYEVREFATTYNEGFADQFSGTTFTEKECTFLQLSSDFRDESELKNLESIDYKEFKKEFGVNKSLALKAWKYFENNCPYTESKEIELTLEELEEIIN